LTPDAILQRLEWGDEGTFGRIFFGSNWLYTGELPPRGNEAGRSCVLAGLYSAAFTPSPAFKRYLYLLSPTAPRAGIRVHPANLMGDVAKGYRSQLNGCIALGERLGWLDRQKAVLLSQSAVRRLESYYGGRSFSLQIFDPK
jgi:hypothetical protein